MATCKLTKLFPHLHSEGYHQHWREEARTLTDEDLINRLDWLISSRPKVTMIPGYYDWITAAQHIRREARRRGLIT